MASKKVHLLRCAAFLIIAAYFMYASFLKAGAPRSLASLAYLYLKLFSLPSVIIILDNQTDNA